MLSKQVVMFTLLVSTVSCAKSWQTGWLPREHTYEQGKRHQVSGKICWLEQSVVANADDGQYFVNEVIAAVRFWNGYLPHRVFRYDPSLPPLHNNPWVYLYIASVGELPTGTGDVTQLRYLSSNRACIRGGEVAIRANEKYKDQRLQIIIHSLGHMLGLDHSYEPNTLMYPTLSSRTKFHLGNDTHAELRVLY